MQKTTSIKNVDYKILHVLCVKLFLHELYFSGYQLKRVYLPAMLD